MPVRFRYVDMFCDKRGPSLVFAIDAEKPEEADAEFRKLHQEFTGEIVSFADRKPTSALIRCENPEDTKSLTVLSEIEKPTE